MLKYTVFNLVRAGVASHMTNCSSHSHSVIKYRSSDLGYSNCTVVNAIWIILVSYPDHSTEEIEKGSGQKGCTSLSPRTKLANQIVSHDESFPFTCFVDGSAEHLRMRRCLSSLFNAHAHAEIWISTPDPFLISSIGGSGYETRHSATAKQRNIRSNNAI